MNTLRLILSNNAVAQSRAKKKIEHSISVSALGLLVAEARWSRVPLHLAVKGGSSWDVDGIVSDNITLCHRESRHGERESMRRTGRQVGLGSIWCTFDFVLALVDSGCLDQRWGDGCDGGGGEFHDGQLCVDEMLRSLSNCCKRKPSNRRVNHVYLYPSTEQIVLQPSHDLLPCRKDFFLGFHNSKAT
jgi:hypothetical protein